MTQRTAAIIGGGPAGLMAAEVLSAAGVSVTVYDRMPSVGRKLLIAGRGGLNLTHSEGFATFLARYGVAGDRLKPVLEAFPPAALVAWAEGLGQATYVGSSGRVFPKAMKASPLLRALLGRLRGQGVTMRLRHDWRGWDAEGALSFQSPEGPVSVTPDVTVLALGGASWPKLGSNGAWAEVLKARGVEMVDFAPANMGVNIAWSEAFKGRFAGEPLKTVRLVADIAERGMTAQWRARGDVTITNYGLEGGAIYALSFALRRAGRAGVEATLTIDLRPDMKAVLLATRIDLAAPGQSLANVLRKAVKLSPLAVNLLREALGRELPNDGAVLAAAIKGASFKVQGVQGLERAISSAGGVAFAAVDERWMLRALPGVFVAGEMMDWEAPTGGYLLQASFAGGVAAAKGALKLLGPS